MLEFDQVAGQESFRFSAAPREAAPDGAPVRLLDGRGGPLARGQRPAVPFGAPFSAFLALSADWAFAALTALPALPALSAFSALPALSADWAFAALTALPALPALSAFSALPALSADWA